MSKESEEKLKNWESEEDADPENDAHQHFTEFHSWNWCDIADEGLRLNNLIFGESVESGSPRSAILDAVAAASYNGAIASVAAALGVDAEGVHEVIARWFDDPDNETPPLTGNNFVRLCCALTRRSKSADGKHHEVDVAPCPEIDDFREEDDEAVRTAITTNEFAQMSADAIIRHCQAYGSPEKEFIEMILREQAEKLRGHAG